MITLTSAGWLLPAASVVCCLAVLGFGLAHAGRRRWLRPARFAFYCQTGLVAVAAAALLQGILTHRFEVEYIFGHSSTDLPLVYLVSTFWAGQEGTFLLWACYGAWFGCILIARARDWEASVMAVHSLVQLLVLGMLLARPPFTLIDLASFAASDQNLIATHFGGVPPQGQGLNVLLQNPWMAIHPPILFLGFASMSLPFSFAVAALLRGDSAGWVPRVQGWTLLAFTILGAGLILGGYWAYETLGWGGYWAWDPVENSSLVPWLFSGALFHGLIYQRVTNGGAARFNLLLAALCFVSVSYGSYLNRSGVLSDFSVHSFVALSPAFNRALMLFAAMPALLFLFVYAWRQPTVTSRRLPAAPASRTQLLQIVVWLLTGSGVVVLIGNSWPLVTGLGDWFPGLGLERSSLDPAFYNQTHTPLAMVMASLLAVVMLTGWDCVRRERLLAGLAVPALIACAAMALAAGLLKSHFDRLAATPDWLLPTARPLAFVWVLLVGLCVLAIAVNVRVLAEDWRAGQRQRLGTHLAHTGFLVMLIGIVASSVYETKTILPLPLGQPAEFMGYQLTYQGLFPRGVDAEVQVQVSDGRRQATLRGLLRPSRDGVIRNPAILKLPGHDLYLEPGEIQPAQEPDGTVMLLDEPLVAGDLTLTFEGFDLDPAKLDPAAFEVVVKLRADRAGETAVVRPVFRVVGGVVRPEAAALPGGGFVEVIDMPAVDPAGKERALVVAIDGADAPSRPEQAVMQATIKPLMSVVWLGCWMLLCGTLWAAWVRAGQAARRGMPAARTLAPRPGEPGEEGGGV